MQRNAGPRPLTVVALGDSITQAVEVPEPERWPQRLETALAARLAPREVTVLNAGASGNTSREGLARIDGVLAGQPDIVLIEFGGNDPVQDADRNVSVDEFLQNLEAFRSRVQGQAGAAIIMVTFPPIMNGWVSEANRHPAHLAHGGIDQHVELYRAATRRFAAQHELPVADIDLALRAAVRQAGWETFYQPDGVHLRSEGNRVVCETVAEHVLRVAQMQTA